MDSDNECVKCGRYSGGGNLCMICEKAALKKNAKKVRKKKLSPVVSEMIGALEAAWSYLEENCLGQGSVQAKVYGALGRAKTEFKL